MCIRDRSEDCEHLATGDQEAGVGCGCGVPWYVSQCRGRGVAVRGSGPYFITHLDMWKMNYAYERMHIKSMNKRGEYESTRVCIALRDNLKCVRYRNNVCI